MKVELIQTMKISMGLWIATIIATGLYLMLTKFLPIIIGINIDFVIVFLLVLVQWIVILLGTIMWAVDSVE